MQCPRCHAENREGRRFCGECGLSFALTCPSCGFVNEGSEKFCGGCGAPSAGSAAAPEGRFGPPESYTPKHLAEKILTSKAALEGERKQVTVLFADLKGSMELLADRDPEEARKLLDPVLEHMMEAVHRYEGTVNQVMGDGIMALFGAPVAHEDHAVRACYAALRMQESVKKYAEEIHRAVGVPVLIRVGLNSGEVVVRSIGSDLRMDYTAVGPTTHLAARMEQMAMPGSILITADTLLLAEGFVQVRVLGPRPVKGLELPVEVCELLGPGTVRSRFHAAAARGLTRFVGRTDELGQLRQALDRAGSGHGQIVAVVGEPGVGKSRLFWEFVQPHRTDNLLVLESGSVSYGKATSYLPVIDLLRTYFQIEARDDTRKIREKVTGKLLSLDRSLESCLLPLLWLLDVALEDAEWDRLDPLQRRQRTLDAVKRLLLRESQVQPLVVIFEDLHWIDSETQALLDVLVESLPTARILLLANYRPEYQHAWAGKSCYRQVRVDPLPTQSVEELLEALLGGDVDLRVLKAMLIERTEGNPFFIEESVRALVETRLLIGKRGAYQLARAPERLEIPVTAQALLAARIDRLSPEDKRLLQAAAVIGTEVPYILLRAIADQSDDALRLSLARLQAAEFLYETRLFPDLEYMFKHALTHEVTYGGLLHERRRALHARIVKAIELCYSDRLTEQVERLAHHAMQGEVWDDAVHYLRQAGVKATERSAFHEAVAYLEQALLALGYLPASLETQRVAIDIRFELNAPLLAAGELYRRLERVEEAEKLAAAIGDTTLQVRALAFTGNCLTHVGRTLEAVRTGERCVELADALADPTLKILARQFLGQAEWQSGAYGGAVVRLRPNVEALQGELGRARLGVGPFPSVLNRFYLGLCLTELGELREAAMNLGEAVRIAEALDDPWSRAVAYYGMAALEIQRGDIERAVTTSARSLELCVTNNLRFLFPIAASVHSYAIALSGRPEDGIPLAERAREATRAIGGGLEAVLVRARLSEAYLLTDRPEAARDTALEALELAEQTGQHGQAAWVCRVLGEIASLHPSLLEDAAEHHYRQALALAEPRGMRPLVAHCHLGLGKLYRRTGKREQAQEHLATATTMYREMDMGFWLEQAEAELTAPEP